MRLFAFFLSLDYTFSLKLHTMIACENVLNLVALKLMEKILGAHVWAKWAKIVLEIRFFTIFSRLVH